MTKREFAESTGPQVQINRHPSGRGYQLTTKLLLHRELDEVWAFFSDAFQLERITPPWLKFQVTTPAPIQIERGTQIDYRLRLHGIPIRWQSCISTWEPAIRFVDEQVRGPYVWWRHEHRFEQTSDGVQMTDTIDYHVPFGWIAQRCLVKHDLTRIFQYRAERIQAILNS